MPNKHNILPLSPSLRSWRLSGFARTFFPPFAPSHLRTFAPFFSPFAPSHLRTFTLALLLCLLLITTLTACQSIKPPRGAEEKRITILTTGYCSCKKCCGWKRKWFGLGRPVYASGPSKGKRKDVGLTASGEHAEQGTIAADTSLFPFGTVMEIPGYGRGIVQDKGSAIKGNHIDLFFEKHKQALKWGKQTKEVTVWVKK